MVSHMGVQAFATERNSYVEYFVYYILQDFGAWLVTERHLQSFKLSSQKHYSSDIASDVWDHFFVGVQTSGRRLELWCQTTCYKGNGTGSPEPNKTYEVRESLVEGVTIREHFRKEQGADYRTIHFTVGDKRYTYKWFLDMKSAVYDLSIYIGEPSVDIFEELTNTIGAAFTEEEMSQLLATATNEESVLGLHIKKAVDRLRAWWLNDNHRSSCLADQQWGLVSKEFEANDGKWPQIEFIKGHNIKGRVNSFVFDEYTEDNDPLIAKTAIRLLKRNPFLQSSIDITSNWADFCDDIRKIASSSNDLLSFIRNLWVTPLSKRLVIRRLLLRIHTKESIDYVQDRNIYGISEHNIYNGDHNPDQVGLICDQIVHSLNDAGLASIDDVVGEIIDNGKRLTNQARWFEAKNGTELKPSFVYVELSLLEAGYKVVSPTAAGIRAIGYHSEISSENVRPYTNLKVVKDALGNTVCIIKAKFFRQQEFPRRCKEEAFVGLSLRYRYTGQDFVRRFTPPLIMFIDMAPDCVPPEHAVKRLISFGWHIVFSTDELLDKISGRSFG